MGFFSNLFKKKQIDGINNSASAPNDNAVKDEVKPIPEMKTITADELDYNEVVNKYITTTHGTCPLEYKYYPYLKAEFDCILNNLSHFNINTHEKLKRKQAILCTYEKSKTITEKSAIKNLKDFVSIDTETTGIKIGGNYIIEVSAIKFIDFKPVEIFTTLCKPRNPIPSDATAINGITDDMVNDKPMFQEIANSLKEFVGGLPMVFHNAPFDLKFLFVSGLEIDFEKAKNM